MIGVTLEQWPREERLGSGDSDWCESIVRRVYIIMNISSEHHLQQHMKSFILIIILHILSSHNCLKMSIIVERSFSSHEELQ